MLKACRAFLGFSSAVVLLSGCATVEPLAVTQDIEFRILPQGTQITLTELDSGAQIGACLSPCTLTVNVTQGSEYTISREGMPDKTGTIPAKFDHPSKARRYAERNTNNLPATYIEGRMETAEQREARLAAMTPMKRRMAMFMEAYKSGDMKTAVAGRDVKSATCPPTETYLKPGDLDRVAMIPPIMAARATKSGHCKVRFDVNQDGEPVNLRTSYCTEEHFSTPSIGAVAFWLFEPKIENGQAVPTCGVETKMTFILQNAYGKVIPE